MQPSPAAEHNGPPGAPVRSRRPTMRDVAAHVGVSQALVSLVFRNAPGASDETRERVFRGAAELGYRPDTAARVLRQTRSRHLGVLFSLQMPYEVDLTEAIYPAAERRGYHVVLGAMTSGRDERQAVEELLSFRSEAIILIAPASGWQELARLGQQVPLIEIGRRLGEDAGVDVVRVDDQQGARLAVDHLVALGHRDIVHVDGAGEPGAAERRRGYRQAMRRHGLQDRTQVLPGDYTEESGAQAARTLLREGQPPSAIFAANDRCAHGVLDTLSRAGLSVPGDVSVVGYDDSRIASLSFIDLTTIRQDAAQMAELAVEAAAQRLDNGRATARDIVVKPALIVRGSTGPAQPRHR